MPLVPGVHMLHPSRTRDCPVPCPSSVVAYVLGGTGLVLAHPLLGLSVVGGHEYAFAVRYDDAQQLATLLDPCGTSYTRGADSVYRTTTGGERGPRGKGGQCSTTPVLTLSRDSSVLVAGKRVGVAERWPTR